MLIIPAIDLLEGKVVRLYKGVKSNCKIYSTDPVQTAKYWQSEGANLIHIVDLDAAFGQGDNLEIIKRIIDTGIKVQVGGGIRSFKKFAKVLHSGADRVIISTKAFDRVFLNTVINFCKSDYLGISVDVLDGKIMKAGWQEKSDYDFLDFIDYLCNKGVKWIIYTDINRDGTLKGVNIDAVRKLKRFKKVNFIVSGGISSLDDIKKLRSETPFIKGIILGKALYEKCIDLKEARSII